MSLRLNSLATLALSIGFVALLGSASSAQAAVAVGVGVGVGGHDEVVVDRQWVPGHYETRLETSPVVERRWVEPVTELRVDRYGRSYSVVVPGYYATVNVPVTHQVTVWVPGYYVAAPVTVVHHHRPVVDIGGVFRF